MKKRDLTPRQEQLLFMPTSETALLAKWQEPYEVQCRNGATICELNLPDNEKKTFQESFHTNVPRAWRETAETVGEQL